MMYFFMSKFNLIKIVSKKDFIFIYLQSKYINIKEASSKKYLDKNIRDFINN